MSILKSTIHEFLEDRCPTVAAALAYFTVFSLPALLVITITLAGFMVGPDVAAKVVEKQLGSALSTQVAGQLNTLLEQLSRNARRGTLSTFIALAAILLVSTKAFAELHRVLNRAWKVETTDSGLRRFALRRASASLLIIALSVLLLLSMVFGTIVLVFSKELALPVVYIWQWVAPAVLLILLVAAVFKILPDAKVHWQDVWFGAIFTGVLLVIGKNLLSLYFSRTMIDNVFGVTGSFALLLLWLYFSYAVLLFGAELTQVRARQQGRRPQPTNNAVRVDRPQSPAA